MPDDTDHTHSVHIRTEAISRILKSLLGHCHTSGRLKREIESMRNELLEGSPDKGSSEEAILSEIKVILHDIPTGRL